MSKPSDPKSETGINSDLPAHALPPAQQGELSEKELNKVTGGISNTQQAGATTASGIIANMKNS